MKRALFLVLVAATVFLAIFSVNVFAAEETLPTDNWINHIEAVTEKDGVYEIESAEQLAWVSYQTLTAKNNFSGKTVKLTKSIDLSKYLWTPIGVSGAPFYGNFDGTNKIFFKKA